MKRRDFLKNTAVFVSGATVSLAALDFIDPRELLASQPGCAGDFWSTPTVVSAAAFASRPARLRTTSRWKPTSPAPGWNATWSARMASRSWTHPKRRCTASPASASTRGSPACWRFPTPRWPRRFSCRSCAITVNYPACVQVCPVGATYQTADGTVLVDRKWCIGCGYCIMGCPYGVRFFHPIEHVADKCTFCYHRITQGGNRLCRRPAPLAPARSATSGIPTTRWPKPSSTSGSACCATNTAPNPTYSISA
jgi:tetrathionate reductase subunit B